MTLGDLAFTPDGLGEIKEIENEGGRSERFGVLLDKDHFESELRYYWKHELRKA